MDYIPKTVKGKGRGWRDNGRGTKSQRRRGKERVEWGGGPWRAVLAFLPRGPRVPSYATGLRHDIAAICMLKIPLNPIHPISARLRVHGFVVCDEGLSAAAD